MAALDSLQAAISAELATPLPEPVRALAAQLAQQGEGALALLFYGSNLRSGDLDGVLDFYVLVEDLRAWYGPRRRVAARFNGWLPPNVSYLEWPQAERRLRAKVAVLSLAQFRRGVAGAGVDTTLWARFAQPAGLAWQRDEAARLAAVAAVAQAVQTAAGWAARLGPERGAARDYWDALFARTYAAELRVESAQRASSIVGHAEPRFQALLPLAWEAASLPFQAMPDGALSPALSPAQRRQALRRWSRQARLGKPLNLLRLIKSAWTFEGGADYLAWKVERHSGVKIELSEFQRRHPVLAAPRVLWQLWRRGVIG